MCLFSHCDLQHEEREREREREREGQVEARLEVLTEQTYASSETQCALSKVTDPDQYIPSCTKDAVIIASGQAANTDRDAHLSERG